jgi:hypothetical protein
VLQDVIQDRPRPLRGDFFYERPKRRINHTGMFASLRSAPAQSIRAAPQTSPAGAAISVWFVHRSGAPSGATRPAAPPLRSPTARSTPRPPTPFSISAMAEPDVDGRLLRLV